MSAGARGLQLWRIGTDTPAFEAHDLTGKGAELTSGRWNRVGTPVVYASTTRALACLETVVHLGGSDPLPLNRYVVEITVQADLWADRTVFDATMHVGWDAEPAGKVSLDWGTAWATANTAVLAEVPSVIVPEEINVLINPRHPDAMSVTALKRRKWTYDVGLR